MGLKTWDYVVPRYKAKRLTNYYPVGKVIRLTRQPEFEYVYVNFSSRSNIRVTRLEMFSKSYLRKARPEELVEGKLAGWLK